MDTTILTAIGSVGFPIVACIFMATYGKKSLDALTSAVNTLISTLQGQDTQILNQIKALTTPSQTTA
jgi:hypothetical protein